MTVIFSSSALFRFRKLCEWLLIILMIIGDADGNEEENVKMWIYQYINFDFRNDEKCEILTANRESNIEHLRHSFTPSRTELRAGTS